MTDKDPRQYDPAYLGWIAALPCSVCLAHGDFKRGVHVAHLRGGSPDHGKRATGLAEKPSDRWTTPLCPEHHVNGPKAQHYHRGGEEQFWADHGIDPFQLCLDLSDAYDNLRPGYAVLAKHAARAHVIRNPQGRQHG